MIVNYLNIPYQLPNPYEVPISRFLSIWKVEVNDKYKAFYPNGLDNPGIFITYEGHGTLYELQNPNVIHRLETNSYFLINRHFPCQYQCVENKIWKFFFLHFSDLDMAEQLQIPIATVCHTETIKYAAQQCERLIQCLIQSKTGYSYTSNQLFQELLISFAREKAERESGKSTEIARTIYWMHQNIDKHIEMDSMIAMSNMSRTLFFRSFKKATNLTPVAYFLKLKLESARLALQTTDQSLKQIALSLQFYDEFHFTKLFKKEYGIPPSTYRLRNK